MNGFHYKIAPLGKHIRMSHASKSIRLSSSLMASRILCMMVLLYSEVFEVYSPEDTLAFGTDLCFFKGRKDWFELWGGWVLWLLWGSSWSSVCDRGCIGRRVLFEVNEESPHSWDVFGGLVILVVEITHVRYSSPGCAIIRVAIVSPF